MLGLQISTAMTGFLHGLSVFEPWSSWLHNKWSYPLSLVLRHCIYLLYCGIQSMWGTKEMLYFAFTLNSLCVSKQFWCSYWVAHNTGFGNKKKQVPGRADVFGYRIHSKHLQLSPHLLHRTCEAQSKQHNRSQFCLGLHGSHQQGLQSQNLRDERGSYIQKGIQCPSGFSWSNFVFLWCCVSSISSLAWLFGSFWRSTQMERQLTTNYYSNPRWSDTFFWPLHESVPMCTKTGVRA